MTLVTCKECGKQISSDAKTCPHCGKQLKASGCSGCTIALGIIGAILIGFFVICTQNFFSMRKRVGEYAEKAKAAEVAKQDTIKKVKSILNQYSDKWKLVSSHRVIRLVYLAHSEIKNERLISAILYKLRYINGHELPAIRIGFYDSMAYTPEALPMNDAEMLHWKAQYNLNLNSGLEEFVFCEILDARVSPPEIRFVDANIRPRLMD